MIKKLELTKYDFEELADYAKRKGIIFLSSPFDKESVDLLDGLNVPAYKIASGEVTNFPLLTQIAKKEKPIILSTGMSTLGEVEEVLNAIRREGDKDVVLLHCVSYLAIPVAHLHGGEITSTVDEFSRHAITKLAHIHFSAAENSAERIIKMGEDLSNVFVVGAPDLDSILNENLIEPTELSEKYNLDISKPILLVVQMF